MAEHLTALAQQPLEAAELEAIIRRAEGNTYYARSCSPRPPAHRPAGRPG
jgi:hypothetical protein